MIVQAAILLGNEFGIYTTTFPRDQWVLIIQERHSITCYWLGLVTDVDAPRHPFHKWHISGPFY